MTSTLEPRTTTGLPAELSGAVPREVQRLLLDAGFQARQLSALCARLGLTGGGSLTLAGLEARDVAANGRQLGLAAMTIRASLTRMPSLERLAHGRYALRTGGTEATR